jgi:hypothetical protein
MDILHIGWAIVMQSIGNSRPADVATCYEDFPTLYVVTIILMVLGYLSILRLLYLIFPHLIGYKFFAYK